MQLHSEDHLYGHKPGFWTDVRLTGNVAFQDDSMLGVELSSKLDHNHPDGVALSSLTFHTYSRDASQESLIMYMPTSEETVCRTTIRHLQLYDAEMQDTKVAYEQSQRLAKDMPGDTLDYLHTLRQREMSLLAAGEEVSSDTEIETARQSYEYYRLYSDRDRSRISRVRFENATGTSDWTVVRNAELKHVAELLRTISRLGIAYE